MAHVRMRHRFRASMLTSAALHAGLVLFMALAAASSDRTHLAVLHMAWSDAAAKQPRTLRLERAEDGVDHLQAAAEEDARAEHAEVAVRDAQVLQPEFVQLVPPVEDSTLAIAELDLSAPISPADSDAPLADRFASGRRGDSSESTGADGEGDDSGGKASGARGTFFGHPISGGRIVFVLDCSGSMNASSGVPKKLRSRQEQEEAGEEGGAATRLAGNVMVRGRHPSRPGYLTRWDRLVEELTAALQGLDQSVEFSIILFSEGFVELEGGMQAADPESKEQAIRWISDVHTGRNTYPLPALQRALEHAPEAIYFLTDGDFEPGVINQITWINNRLDKPATIHTIGLGDLRGRVRLTNLARRNGGEFLIGR